MLDASLILLLLSFLIKIHKKNIYHQISLLMKFQILKKNYSNKKMIDSIKYEIKDQNLI
ncbi:hypothetical protein IKS57_02900 [bacterium]|nr:hypothetical protein [bacterium]